MKKTSYIVVLDDGETFAPIEGCTIMEITEEAVESLEEGEYPKNLDNGYVMADMPLKEVVESYVEVIPPKKP